MIGLVLIAGNLWDNCVHFAKVGRVLFPNMQHAERGDAINAIQHDLSYDYSGDVIETTRVESRPRLGAKFLDIVSGQDTATHWHGYASAAHAESLVGNGSS